MLGWVPKTEDLLPIGDEVTSGIGQMCALPSLPRVCLSGSLKARILLLLAHRLTLKAVRESQSRYLGRDSGVESALFGISINLARYRCCSVHELALGEGVTVAQSIFGLQLSPGTKYKNKTLSIYTIKIRSVRHSNDRLSELAPTSLRQPWLPLTVVLSFCDPDLPSPRL